jgi:hypothetical protein
MMRILTTLIALSLASPALAGDMTPATTSAFIYGATTADEPFVSPAEQARRNAAHELQIICNSDFNAVEYVTHCHAQTFGAPQMGSDD